MLHLVLPHQLGQPGNGLLPLPRTVGGVDHRGVQHLSGAVHHRHLTAHAVAGVQSHGHPALHRGLHQQGLQIQGEGADGPLVGLLGELCPDLPLQRGLKQPLPGVVRRPPDKFHGGGPRDGPAPDHHPGSLRIQLHRYLQQLLPLPPVDGQRLIALDPAHRALEIVVQTVDAVLRLLARRFGGQYAPAEVQLAQLLPQVGPVGDLLSQDVAGPLECGLHRLHPLFRVHIVLCGPLQIHRRPPGRGQGGQRLQSLLPGHGGAGAPLLLIGAVQVLHLRQRGGGVQCGGQVLGELALPLDGGADLLFPGGQAPEILQAVGQPAQQLVVHRAVQLLPVSGDEGDGGPLVDQPDHIFHVLRGGVQLPGQRLYQIIHGRCSFVLLFPSLAERGKKVQCIRRKILPGKHQSISSANFKKLFANFTFLCGMV